MSKVDTVNTESSAAARGARSDSRMPTSAKSSGPSTLITRHGPTTSDPVGSEPAGHTIESSVAVVVTDQNPCVGVGTALSGGSRHTEHSCSSTLKATTRDTGRTYTGG